MLLSLLVVLGVAQAAPSSTVTVETPRKVAEIDTGKLKGEPTELAWSPDGTQLFLQTSERDSRGMVTKPRFFVMSAADGKPKSVDAKPAWESEYWTWKSNKYVPGSTTMGIDIQEEMKQASATANPRGGSLAKGGTSAANSATVDDMTLAASQMQNVHVFTLTFKGEKVGEFVNQQFLPGYTFGWSPKALGMIAYVNDSGRLALMDVQTGRKQQMESTKNVLLPAWTTDGTKIAFFEKTGKNKYDLYVANVRP